jgi:hypothetical protein
MRSAAKLSPRLAADQSGQTLNSFGSNRATLSHPGNFQTQKVESDQLSSSSAPLEQLQERGLNVYVSEVCARPRLTLEQSMRTLKNLCPGSHVSRAPRYQYSTAVAITAVS